nr:MMPL family transporter [Kineosphaera limosa]
MVRRPRAAIVAVVFILLGLGVSGLGPMTSAGSPTAGLPDRADSTLVAQKLAETDDGSGSVAVALWTADNGALTQAQLADINRQALARLSAAGNGPPPGAAAPEGTAGARGGPVEVSEDGTAAIAPIPVAASDSSENAAAVEQLRQELRAAAPEGTQIALTGPAAVRADLASVFDGADVQLLLASAAVVAVLLIVTYRSPILWLVPLSLVAIAERTATTVASRIVDGVGLVWDAQVGGIVSVLIFGAGTNYGLLLISRYRDELRTTEDKYAAMRAALRRAGEAIFASGSTVIIGVIVLIASLTPATRALGVGSAVGIVVAMLFALIVLPTTLVLFGRRIFWPLVPQVAADGEAAQAAEASLWRTVGNGVARRPAAAIAAVLILLAGLGVGATQVQTGLSTQEQLLDAPEAVTAGKRLAQSFPAGDADPLIVLAPDAQAAIATAQNVPGVVSARPAGEVGDLDRVDVVLAAAPGSDAAEQGVHDLRAAYADSGALIGGNQAQEVDSQAAQVRDRWVLMPAILLLVLGGLMVMLRAVVAPIILIATVLATYAAALGAGWWIFTGPLGYSALDGSVPLYTFLFLVALGVDYNIFLVTRAAEERARHGTKLGMLRALGATGGVITSAGILLASVFAVLGVLPLVALAQIGVIIGIGVLLDTLIVRTMLVPAIAITLGDRFWWPRKAPAPVGDAADRGGIERNGDASPQGAARANRSTSVGSSKSRHVV